MSLLSRRSWLASAGAFFAWPLLAAKDFWDTKEPADWSNDEIKKLLTKSPWAHEVDGERTTTSKPKESGFPRQTTNARGQTRVTVPNAQAPKTRVTGTYRGSVVWESARPIRLAVKDALPGDFADMYVLSLSGVPKGGVERFRAATTLRAKGRDPLEAALAKRAAERDDMVLFGFSRQGLEISKDDKEIVFATTVNRIALSAKFNPRDMLYRGELAL